MNEMIAVATASQPMEATTIQVQLESCGINTELEDEFTVTVNPLLSYAVGGIKILVAAEDEEQAISILADHRKDKAEQEALLAKTCTECENTNGEIITRPNWVGILSVLSLGVFSLLYPWPKYKCPNCNHKWR